MIWSGLVVVGLLATGWLLDRYGASRQSAARGFRRSSVDLARGEQYRFMRRGG